MKGKKDLGGLGLSSLKDKSLSWKQRLSLAKNLWSSQKYVPRKEQVIVDWLTFSLHSSTSKSESLPSAEKALIWEVLAQILSSEQVLKVSEAGDTINISLWFYKDIQEALKEASDTKPIVDCLLAITSRKCFKTFSFLSLDHLVELLSTCCLCFTKASASSTPATGSTPNSNWSPLLMNLGTRLRDATSKRTLPVTLIAVFANKLFVPLVSAYTCLHKDPIADLLMDTLLCAVTHRDTLKHYERYLKENPPLNTADSKPSSAQKRENFVEVLFGHIREGLQSEKEMVVDAHLHVLSTLYKSYLVSCGDSTFKLDKVGMLYALMKLPAGVKSQAYKLKGWADLLSLAAKFDIHGITSEEAPKEAAAFSRTISHLLTLGCTTAAWYRCVAAILDINHKCVEKRLSEVLAVGWQRVHKITEWETEEAQAKLLTSLLSVYSRLRQLPKIVNVMVDCIVSNDNAAPLPALALKSLGELITTTPPTVCYDLWLSLYSKVIEQARSLSDKSGNSKCIACADILHTIMYHMKVYDSNVPLSVRNKLADSLSSMQRDLGEEIQKCKQNTKKMKLSLPVLLLLLDSCSAMSTLLYRYVSTTIDLSPQLCIEPALDLVDSMLAQRLPQETESLVRFSSVKLCYHWLSFLELCPPPTAKAISSQVDECLAKFLGLWREGGVSEQSLQPWYNTILDVRVSNLTTAMLSLISTSAMLCYVSRSNSTNKDLFSSLLVKAGGPIYNHFGSCMCCHMPEDLHISVADADSAPNTTHNSLKCVNVCRSKEQVSSYGQLQLLLTACLSSGDSTLYASLVKEVISKVAPAFTDSVNIPESESPRSKRRKLNAVNREENDINRTLALFFQALEEKPEASQRLAELTNQVLAIPEVALTSQHLSYLLLATDVLQRVPLRCIDATTHRKIFYMSLVIVKLLTASTNIQGNKCAIERVHMLIICQLFSSITCESKLVELLNVEIFAGLFGQLPREVGRCKDVALDTLVSLVCTQQAVFNKHKAYLDKLLDELFTPDTASTDQKITLPLAIIRAVLQTGSVKPAEPVVHWALKRSNDLLSYISSHWATDQFLPDHLLSWCCLATTTHRKLHIVDKLFKVTKLVLKELEVIVREETVSTNNRTELLLRYVICAINSADGGQPLPLELTALWEHIMCLASRTGLANDVITEVVCSLLTAMDADRLSVCLSQLHGPTVAAAQSGGKLLSVVLVWRSIISAGESVVKDKLPVVERHCQQFVSDSHSYICQLTDLLDVSVYPLQQVSQTRNQLTELISLLGVIVSKGKTLCTSQAVSGILLGVQLIQYNKDIYKVTQLLAPISASQRLLRAILLHHQNSANNSLHVFSAICMNLVNAVISFADQSILSDHENSAAISETETELLACCQELHKVFATMADYPKIFSKVSSFLLADVVHSLHSITLLPNVKKALHLAVNGLFDMMDEHSDMMLKVNLGEASREMYKTMQSRYVKYHKYTGKV